MHGGPSLEDMLAELLEQEGPPEVPIPLADAEDLPAPVHSKKRKVRCTASFPPRQGEQRSFYSFLWLASFCGLVGFGQLSSVIPDCPAVTEGGSSASRVWSEAASKGKGSGSSCSWCCCCCCRWCCTSSCSSCWRDHGGDAKLHAGRGLREQTQPITVTKKIRAETRAKLSSSQPQRKLPKSARNSSMTSLQSLGWSVGNCPSPR